MDEVTRASSSLVYSGVKGRAGYQLQRWKGLCRRCYSGRTVDFAHNPIEGYFAFTLVRSSWASKTPGSQEDLMLASEDQVCLFTAQRFEDKPKAIGVYVARGRFHEVIVFLLVRGLVHL